MYDDDDTAGVDSNDMTAEQWDDFYADCERRSGMDFDEYLDNDMSMNG